MAQQQASKAGSTLQVASQRLDGTSREAAGPCNQYTEMRQKPMVGMKSAYLAKHWSSSPIKTHLLQLLAVPPPCAERQSQLGHPGVCLQCGSRVEKAHE